MATTRKFKTTSNVMERTKVVMIGHWMLAADNHVHECENLKKSIGNSKINAKQLSYLLSCIHYKGIHTVPSIILLIENIVDRHNLRQDLELSKYRWDELTQGLGKLYPEIITGVPEVIEPIKDEEPSKDEEGASSNCEITVKSKKKASVVTMGQMTEIETNEVLKKIITDWEEEWEKENKAPKKKPSLLESLRDSFYSTFF
tara:strand:+ start:3145 stop:3747 length:603 start_codon:yes stop_codon:yes gene_type:complete